MSARLARCLAGLAVALFRPRGPASRPSWTRRLYRSRDDAARTLDLFAVRLRDEVDLDALTRDLRTAAREALQPASVSL